MNPNNGTNNGGMTTKNTSKASAKKTSTERKNPAGAANQLAAKKAKAVAPEATPVKETPAPKPPAEKIVTPAAKPAKEVRVAAAILKLASLDKVTKLPIARLNAMPEPTAKAVADLLAQAKAIGLDITKGSWEAKARAFKAGDLKAALKA
jgi:hypothetical protein